MNKEIEIPEGYEAKIENNKVIFVPKESEDERIRKELIEYLTHRTEVTGFIDEDKDCKRWIAYLEKQKEQKPLMCDGEIEDRKRDIVAAIRKFYPADYAEYLTSFLKGLSPEDNSDDEYGQEMLGIAYKLMYEHIPENLRTQEFWDSLKFMREYTGKVAIIHSYEKPAEWSEDWREEDIQTRFAFYTYKDDPSVLYLSNVFVEETSRNHGFGTRILRAAEKVAETIGATTISLKVKQDSPANAWYRKNGYGYVAFEDGYDWLEKNLEYLKPAKSAEWSEEDEQIYNSFKTICEILIKNPHGEKFEADAVYAEKMLSWLKSLRPQPHWKPSEEQMEAIENVIKCELSAGLHTRANILQTLQNELKKL